MNHILLNLRLTMFPFMIWLYCICSQYVSWIVLFFFLFIVLAVWIPTWLFLLTLLLNSSKAAFNWFTHGIYIFILSDTRLITGWFYIFYHTLIHILDLLCMSVMFFFLIRVCFWKWVIFMQCTII